MDEQLLAILVALEELEEGCEMGEYDDGDSSVAYAYVTTARTAVHNCIEALGYYDTGDCE